MITSKELQYVSLWANQTPMPGYDYSIAVLKEVKKCYEVYNKKYKDKEYSMVFSNSEEIEFQILEKNLCHMLGIDYNNIRGNYFDKYRKNVFNIKSNDFTSYELVELILENMEKVAEYDNSTRAAKAINYYKSSVKCSIFNKLSDFSKFNFAAINYIGVNDYYEYDKQKLLFVPSNEVITPYFMMGIRIDEEENKFVVTSLIAPESPKKFFENQEVIIPTQIIISNNEELKIIKATPKEKIQLLSMYQSIINKYQIPNNINIYGDYEEMLNTQCNPKKLKK